MTALTISVHGPFTPRVFSQRAVKYIHLPRSSPSKERRSGERVANSLLVSFDQLTGGVSAITQRSGENIFPYVDKVFPYGERVVFGAGESVPLGGRKYGGKEMTFRKEM
jgi:hypothetical protein